MVDQSEILEISAKGITAEGDLIDDGFVVFKGSRARKDTTASCQEYIINVREKLMKDEILVEENGHLRFQENYVFNSPSTAGGVVLGRSTNGWTAWKNKEGKTLG